MGTRVRKLVSAAAAGLFALSIGAVAYAAEGEAPKDQAATAPSADANTHSDMSAVVNGKFIPKKLLDKVMEQAAASGQPDVPEVRRQVLNRLVDMELVAQDAVKKGYDKDPEFLLGMDMLRIQQLYAIEMTKEILDTVKLGPDDAKKYYDEHKADYKSEEEVKASHILVDTEEDIKKAKERLDKGEDFAEVAKSASKCPSAPRGGDLGFFGKGRMVPEFEKVAFSLKEGEVSAPVKTQFGWHIIKATGRKEAKQQTLDEVKADIEKKLTSDRQQKAYNDIMTKLRAEGSVKIIEQPVAAPAPTATPAEAAAPVTDEKPADVAAPVATPAPAATDKPADVAAPVAAPTEKPADKPADGAAK